MKKIYLDHAATTPTHPAVIKAMQPYFGEKFGNPSSLYSWGQEAKDAIENAREKVAQTLGAKPEEIIFTSGGTEADNFALHGIAYANDLSRVPSRGKKGNHIITSAIEHHAVLEPAHFLEKRGFKVTYLPVDKYGLIDPQDVAKAIGDKTVLVSIMLANNEIGTIEPIEKISKITKEKGVYFHSDAAQGIGALPINVDKLGVDLLSLSAHKFYGPKGVGALYVRKGTRIVPYLRGGGQERKRRASTENVPGIVGLGKAIELATQDIPKKSQHLRSLKDKLIKGISEKIEKTRLNGHPEKRLPNNASFCFAEIEGESILLNLDLQGVAASSGSACTSGSLEASHVLLAIGLDHATAHGSLRLTLGNENTEEDVNYILEILPPIIEKLRAMSPLAKK